MNRSRQCHWLDGKDWENHWENHDISFTCFRLVNYFYSFFSSSNIVYYRTIMIHIVLLWYTLSHNVWIVPCSQLFLGLHNVKFGAMEVPLVRRNRDQRLKEASLWIFFRRHVFWHLGNLSWFINNFPDSPMSCQSFLWRSKHFQSPPKAAGWDGWSET